MLDSNTNIILFFHEPGTCGDAVLKILNDATLDGKQLVTTHDFLLNRDGRSDPELKKEYANLLGSVREPRHSHLWEDMTIIRRWMDHAKSRDQILIMRLCEHWQSVSNIQKAIENSFTITMGIPDNMHQCVLKNRHKTTQDIPFFNDENFEKLRRKDKSKALGFLYTKMLKSGEGVHFDHKVRNFKEVDYLCDIESLHTNNFVDVLSADLGLEIGIDGKAYHNEWLSQQSPLYKFNLFTNNKFKECFGYNSKAPVSDQTFELTWLDKSFLLYYQKFHNLPNIPISNTTIDVINYFQKL
jgi:hypothetical protein|tara:strand:+ start:586 stop:1479 length:894 start_codon:yes stop_codon:yes gene_type:complete